MKVELPDIIPVFPLSGALLLPGGFLPLNIFEPRYIAMTEDAMHSNKLIGMIQPTDELMPCGSPHLHKTGCVGAISEFAETPEGHYMIVLAGLRRFTVLEELPPARGYRLVRPQWLSDKSSPTPLDRALLMPLLRDYFRQEQLDCNWSAVEQCEDNKLITSLAMICPFTPAEQQALLEAQDLEQRAKLLLCLLSPGHGCGEGGKAN